MNLITSATRSTDKQARIHPYAAFRETSADPVQVVCPQCGDRGRVYPLRFARDPHESGGLYLCDSCALAITGLDSVATFLWNDDVAPLDAVFHLPLWMQTPCCGHLLWAFNLRHLQLLIEIVGRPLTGEPGVSLIGEVGATVRRCMDLMQLAGLPGWLRAEENRAEVIVALNRLKALGPARPEKTAR